jgi:hypothetical protein
MASYKINDMRHYVFFIKCMGSTGVFKLRSCCGSLHKGDTPLQPDLCASSFLSLVVVAAEYSALALATYRSLVYFHC